MGKLAFIDRTARNFPFGKPCFTAAFPITPFGVDQMYKHRGKIEPLKIEEHVSMTAKNKGEYKEISFTNALSIVGDDYALYSDRSGNYLFAREPPNAFFSSIQSCPDGMKFRYNRVQRRLIVSRSGKVMCTVVTEN